MKKSRKKLIVIIIGVVGLSAVFFFFFAPGWMFGGINYINPNSEVTVFEWVHTPRWIPGRVEGTAFEVSEIIAHDLNPQQVEELSQLLSNSWFGRTIRQGILMKTFPDNAQGFSDFSIHISDGVNRSIYLDSTWGRWIWRSGRYNNRLRIHSPNWNYEILRILEVDTYEK